MAAAPMTGMAVAMAKLSDSAEDEAASLPLAAAAPAPVVAVAVVVMDWVLGWLVSVPLETNVGGSGELHDGVGRGGADVSGAADGVQVGVDADVGGGLNDGSEDGHQSGRNANVGRGLNVGNNNASGISGGGGDSASGSAAAAAVGLIGTIVRVAVCEDGGGKAEDEAVLDLHIEGWRLVLGGG
jgi:hypothetical protein